MALQIAVFLLAFAAVYDTEQATLIVRDPICLDGEFHKTSPSPEGPQYAACHMFQNSSCCTADLTQQLDASPITKVGNFSWDTCGQLSSRCEAYMKEIECFYQCSPLVGYWKGQYVGSFVNVPMCSHVCDSWFDACKSDMTCAHNWITDFNKSSDGSNTCKTNSPCRNFTEVYGNAQGLCEGMWGASFKYKVSQEQHDCLELNFSMPITDINYQVVLKTFGIPSVAASSACCSFLLTVTLFAVALFVGQ